jgi:hypothetical protein
VSIALARATQAEYAPASIHHVYDRLCQLRPRVPWQLGGIIGDAQHTYGYHHSRNSLPRDDYSVVLKRDQGGPGDAASAIDITPPDREHQTRLTRRLRRAIEAHDARIWRCVREVYGSEDGTTVWGWDLATNSASTSSISHTWHIHVSFYRDTLDRTALLAGVADVLAGLKW